jgi:hypothetical protein
MTLPPAPQPDPVQEGGPCDRLAELGALRKLIVQGELPALRAVTGAVTMRQGGAPGRGQGARSTGELADLPPALRWREWNGGSSDALRIRLAGAAPGAWPGSWGRGASIELLVAHLCVDY